jgi:cell division inhibitor SepF
MIYAGLWSKMANFLTVRDADDEFEDDFQSEDGKPNVVSLQDAKSSRRVSVSIFHPRRFEDVSEMADNLRARMLVMANLVGTDRVLSQRLVDFLSGVIYTLDGKMQRVAEGIYLFVPSNVQINAKDAESAVGGAYESY